MSEINVIVIKYERKKFLYMRYVDPLTNKRVERSTGCTKRREAQKVAAKWESELEDGRYKETSKVTWSEFRERYENEVLASLAETTDCKASGIFNMLERLMNPDKLASVNAERISQLCQMLRDGDADADKPRKPRAESTIKGYLAHIKAALNWAQEQGMLVEVPKMKMPKRAKSSKMMKGRPITTEEFERMLAKTEDVTGKHASDSWKYFIRGLWLSGLRLAESLELHWDRTDKLSVDLTGRRPLLWIPGELEKGNQDRLLPVAPEFAEFLLQTPENERNGRVFSPLSRNGRGPIQRADTTSDIISLIGKAANVKVQTDARSGKVKYASAHDLRRSFGERWSSRVMPQVLMELMRHESIETTMKFYVGRNAQRTADVLWEAHEKATSGGTSGGTSPNASEHHASRNAASRNDQTS